MILAWLLLLTGLTISSVAIYYSVVGLTAIFSAAAIPIMIMGVSLEVAKLVCATWIKQYWTRVPMLMKTYMVTAVVLLMLITSMGIFGFLSKAHNDQNLVSGDVQSKIAIYDEKIKTARDNIEANRKALKQMDEAVDQVMGRSTDEKGADKAVAIRRSQAKDRQALGRDIEANQRIISTLNDEAAPIRAEVRKVEAEVGPIKYIAAFLYGVTPDAGMLEKAVTWIIITIVVVFDPLAVIMLLAAQMTFAWRRGEETDAEAHTRIESELAETMHDLGIVNTPVEEPKTKIDFEGVRMPNGEWVQTGPAFEVPAGTPGYKADDGALTDNQIDQINAMLADHAETVESIVVDEQPESKTVDEIVDEIIEKLPPEEAVVPESPNTRTSEAAPGTNRGVMYSQPVVADNSPTLGKASNSDFGNEYPANPEKGDVYLRTDYLPNRLFKYNGFKWIEVDKSSTDVYAYEEAYIRHLIEEIEAGRYDPDALTEVERDQIANYLKKNA
jgi:Skp family chaperone for outer membrane proteins